MSHNTNALFKRELERVSGRQLAPYLERSDTMGGSKPATALMLTRSLSNRAYHSQDTAAGGLAGGRAIARMDARITQTPACATATNYYE